MKDIQIIDNSSDKKYFSIIPNYIVNHSNHWEQSLYLVMKRLAGESGTCFASSQTIAKMMGASKPTVYRTINQLEKRGWIKYVGERPSKTHPTSEYEIVDLWKLNIDFYESQKIDKLQIQSNDKGKDRTTTDTMIDKPQITKEEYIKKNNIPLSYDKQVVVDKGNNIITGKQVNDLIALFEPIKPSYERLFPNKGQRSAIERLAKKYGYDKTERMLKELPNIAKKPYAPVVTTPTQLEAKLGQIVIFVDREKSKGGGIIDARHVK